MKQVLACCLSLMVLVSLSGCHVQGRITDADTGAPMGDVNVGIIAKVLPSPHGYQPINKAQTDSDGRFDFTHFRLDARLFVRAEDYRTERIRLDPVSRDPVDLQLQSIAAIKGDWDVTIALDNGDIVQALFAFQEDGMEWWEAPYIQGVAPFSLEGNRIEVGEYLMIGDYTTSGRVQTSLLLSESGNEFTGDVTYTLFFDENECNPCTGTLEGVRQE